MTGTIGGLNFSIVFDLTCLPSLLPSFSIQMTELCFEVTET